MATKPTLVVDNKYQSIVDDIRLHPNADWQTQSRGDNNSEYQIYLAAAESLGWKVKTFDEWLNS